MWNKDLISYGKLVVDPTSAIRRATKSSSTLGITFLTSNHGPENISVPARAAQSESAAGRPAQSESEALASQLAKDHDFSVAACQRLLASVEFKKDPIQRSVVQGRKAKVSTLSWESTLMVAFRVLLGKVMIIQSLLSIFASS